MSTFSKSTIVLAILGLSLPVQGIRNERDFSDFQLHGRQAKASGQYSASVVLDNGFWFTNVTVGSGPPVELLVDTGSADLVLNPGKYKRGTGSVDLQKNFEITYGTTTGNAAGSSSQSLTGALYNDSVTFPSFPQTGLTLNPQTVGLVVSNSSNSSNIYPRDGIIGLGAQRFSGTNATTFFHNLCERNLLDDCRFGLALESTGEGTLALGGVSDALPGGEKSLTKVPILEEWFVAGDLAVDGKIIQKDLVVEFDSGSSSILGPIDTVSALFDRLGIQSVLQPSDSGDTLAGYYPCGKTFNIGFSFPSQSNISAAAGSGLDISNASKIFNVLQDALSIGPVDAEGKNCSSVISGFDFVALPGLWVVGQAFFQGKYIDHSLVNGSLGLAQLNSSSINPRNASTTSSTTPAKSTTVSAGNHSKDVVPRLFGFILLAALLLLA